MLSIKVIQQSDRDSILEITQPVIQKYCEKNGYGYCKVENKKTAGPHSALWNKFLAIISEIDTQSENRDYDWFIWIDDDILIMNSDISLEMFVSQNPDTYFKFSQFAKGYFHSGIFGVRNELLSSIMFGNFYIEKQFFSKEYNVLSGEEKALCEFFTRKNVIKFVDDSVDSAILFTYPSDIQLYREIISSSNNMHHFKHGDFMIHPMGLTTEAKRSLLKTYAVGAY